MIFWVKIRQWRLFLFYRNNNLFFLSLLFVHDVQLSLFSYLLTNHSLVVEEVDTLSSGKRGFGIGKRVEAVEGIKDSQDR